MYTWCFLYSQCELWKLPLRNLLSYRAQHEPPSVTAIVAEMGVLSSPSTPTAWLTMEVQVAMFTALTRADQRENAH